MYRNLISCHVSDGVRDSFSALARSRGLTMAALLRQIIVRETLKRAGTQEHTWEMTVFLTLAVDGLLGVQPDPELRPKIIQLWQERLAEEARRHAD